MEVSLHSLNSPVNYTEICSLCEYGINMRIDENCVAGIMMLLV